MKDKKWKEMVEKQGQLRHFGSMAIRKAGKGKQISAQEIDLLFRVALAKEAMTPGQITDAMGISKTIVSRLVEQLVRKKFIEREADNSDKRSYTIQVTEKGKEEIDKMYYYYLDPLYLLKRKMGEDKFEQLFGMIREANEILSDASEEKE